MVDGVGNAGVFGDGLVGKVNLAVLVQRHVFKQGVALDGVVDVRLGILIQIDDLRVAAAFKVEHTLVVPAVFVVADQQTLGVGGQGGLASAGETEEDGGIFTVHVRVGRAVHGGNALERQEVVHHGEHTLLHFAAVPGIDDDLLTGGDVEGHAGFGVQTQLLVVFDLRLGSVVNDKVRLEVFQLLLGGADKHVFNEMSLPSHFHDKADGHAGVMVRAAEGIHDVQALVAQFLGRQVLNGLPDLFAHGMVVVLVFGRRPPHGILGIFVNNDVLVLGGAAGVYAGHDVDRAQLADLTLFIALQTGLGLFRKQHFIGGIVNDFLGAGNAVLIEIDVCHFYRTSFLSNQDSMSAYAAPVSSKALLSV